MVSNGSSHDRDQNLFVTHRGAYLLRDPLKLTPLVEVWRAHRTEYPKREVALKIYPRGRAAVSQRNRPGVERQIFRLLPRAASAAQLVDHGHSVTGVDYVATRFLTGRTLKEKLEMGRMSPAEIFDMVESCLRALRILHKTSIAHLDVKPSNLGLMYERLKQRVSLIDFANSRVFADLPQRKVEERHDPDSQSSSFLLRESEVRHAFSPVYCSPEQAMGTAAGTRSDVYSLGCVLFEMITGRPPFGIRSPPSLMQAHVYDEPTIRDNFDTRFWPGDPSYSINIACALMLRKKQSMRPSAGQLIRFFELARLRTFDGVSPLESYLPRSLGKGNPREEWLDIYRGPVSVVEPDAQQFTRGFASDY